MAVNITVTLTAPDSDVVTLCAPAPDIVVPVTVPGVTHRAVGGSLVQYKVGTPYWEATLSIPIMSNAEKDALEVFFRDHWHEDITYTDENSNTFTVHFLDTSLPLKKAAKNSWSVDLRLDFSAVLI